MNKEQLLGLAFTTSWIGMGAIAVLWAVPNLPVAAVAGMPVLVLLPWVARGRPRAQMLATMVAMLYFIAATTELVASTSRIFPSLLLGFSVLPVLVLIVLNAQRRWSLRAQPRDQETSQR